jgi:3-hydroxyisobutyrate dehydrogenase-like beta-hydroxyacid dehydrogenase
MDERIGIIHPGAMGIFVAASMVNSGYEVCWASEGRSAATARRAERFGLMDVGDLASLCRKSDILVSVCPPHTALEIAEQVVSYNFTGIFVDANAISPQKSLKIAELMKGAEVSFVDGGIIGGPNWEKSSTRLYLSGENADEIQRFFVGGLLQTENLGDEIGRASALKMCYAAYTKGVSALLASILALAENHHVNNELAARWEEDWPGLYAASQERIKKAAVKAWRFEGEMNEISETFSKAGIPGGFHLAASDIYSSLGEYKNMKDLPDVEPILQTILGNK